MTIYQFSKALLLTFALNALFGVLFPTLWLQFTWANIGVITLGVFVALQYVTMNRTSRSAWVAFLSSLVVLAAYIFKVF